MTAHSMTGHYQLMMMPIATMQNLDRAMKGANIGVEKMVVSCLATAEASLLKDEKNMVSVLSILVQVLPIWQFI